MLTQELTQLLARADVLITYVPVRREVSFTHLLPCLEGKDMREIKPDALLDPHAEATKAVTLSNGRETIVLVPGTRFDATGTRHGKGAGWYDRFLAAIPSSWIRIGFCTADQFSSEPLVRETWDEPMDYVVVVTDGIPTCYTTHARPAML